MRTPFNLACRLIGLILFSVACPRMEAATEKDPSDELMEDFLLNARVARIFEMLHGSTSPMGVELEQWGTIRKAVFKYRPPDLPGPDDVDAEHLALGAVDSYLHEVAAYRLDRALGLGMVPVAVIRDVHAEGAIIEWVSDAFTAQELRETGDFPAGSSLLIDQQALMSLFDALILNKDRKESDQLITPQDWKLHLVDHSRAFQLGNEILPRFVSQPARLPRSFLHRLVALNAESLTVLFKDLLTDAQIEALLDRRDRILEKVESDRRKYGDDKVFTD